MYLGDISVETAMMSMCIPFTVVAPMKVGEVLFPFSMSKSLSSRRSSNSWPLRSVSGDPHIIEWAFESIHTMTGVLFSLTYANSSPNFSGNGRDEGLASQYMLVMSVFLPSI